MKVACLILVIVNILLFAVAGYRVFTVEPSEVRDKRERMSEALSNAMMSGIEQGMAQEGMTWDDFNQGFEDGYSDGDDGPAMGEWGQPNPDNVTDFSEGDPFAEDTQGQRQQNLDAFKGQVGETFGVDN